MVNQQCVKGNVSYVSNVARKYGKIPVLSAVNDNGRFCIHEAARNGKTDLVDFLLIMDPSQVQKTDFMHGTPLHLAAFSGSVNASKLLMKYQADPNARNFAGETPLHQIVKSPGTRTRIPLIRLLMERGVDLEMKSSGGDTALLLAIRLKMTEMIKELVKLGAKTDGLRVMSFPYYIRQAIKDGKNLISE